MYRVSQFPSEMSKLVVTDVQTFSENVVDSLQHTYFLTIFSKSGSKTLFDIVWAGPSMGRKNSQKVFLCKIDVQKNEPKDCPTTRCHISSYKTRGYYFFISF
jgi:hypothetical protein